MRDQALILRFLALYFFAHEYHRPMKEFLNRFMAKNHRLNLHTKDEIEAVFRRSIHVVKQCLGKSAFKPKRALNTAVFDAVMVGIVRRLERSELTCDELESSYERLLVDHFGLSRDGHRRNLFGLRGAEGPPAPRNVRNSSDGPVSKPEHDQDPWPRKRPQPCMG